MPLDFLIFLSLCFCCFRYNESLATPPLIILTTSAIMLNATLFNSMGYLCAAALFIAGFVYQRGKFKSLSVLLPYILTALYLTFYGVWDYVNMYQTMLYSIHPYIMTVFYASFCWSSWSFKHVRGSANTVNHSLGALNKKYNRASFNEARTKKGAA